MVRFDGYTATSPQIDPRAAIAILSGPTPLGDRCRPTRPFHGFRHRAAVKGEDGTETGSVSWGREADELVMVEVKGETTPEVVSALRAEFPSHRCTRVDACADFERPGVWDELLAEVIEVKKLYKLRGEKRGDWDFPQDGRTQYLGSPKSTTRVRLYEKGKQPDLRHLDRPDLVRLEIQVRPVKAARDAYAFADASQVWGASPFTRDLAARVLRLELDPLPAGNVYKETARDAALRWMCKQYGPHLLSLRDDLGDWACVGKTLGEIINANDSEGWAS